MVIPYFFLFCIKFSFRKTPDIEAAVVKALLQYSVGKKFALDIILNTLSLQKEH